MNIVGLLLAGGQSRRMGGGDKALRLLGGISLLERVIARLRPQVAKVIGVRFFMQAGQDVTIGGRLSQAQYQYTLTDTDSNELNHWAPIMLGKMQAMNILTDVASDQQIASPHIPIEVDRDSAYRLGISLATIDAALYAAFGQQQVTTIYSATQQTKVILEVQPRFQIGATALSRIYIPGTNGVQVPLSRPPCDTYKVFGAAAWAAAGANAPKASTAAAPSAVAAYRAARPRRQEKACVFMDTPPWLPVTDLVTAGG